MATKSNSSYSSFKRFYLHSPDLEQVENEEDRARLAMRADPMFRRHGITEYSSRNLTVPDDRFPALARLARETAQRT